MKKGDCVTILTVTGFVYANHVVERTTKNSIVIDYPPPRSGNYMEIPLAWIKNMIVKEKE